MSFTATSPKSEASRFPLILLADQAPGEGRFAGHSEGRRLGRDLSSGSDTRKVSMLFVSVSASRAVGYRLSRLRRQFGPFRLTGGSPVSPLHRRSLGRYLPDIARASRGAWRKCLDSFLCTPMRTIQPRRGRRSGIRSSAAGESWCDSPFAHNSATQEIAEWQQGCDDARAFRLMRSGMSGAYYDGYAFACAVEGLA